MSQQRKRRLLILSAILLALILVCSFSVFIPARMLVITRLGVAPWRHPASFAHVTYNTDDIRQLEQTMEALPAFPQCSTQPCIRSCPADFGVAYDLRFMGHGQTHLAAQVRPTGCATVILPNDDARQPDDAFWHLLERIMGISEQDLFAAS